ncbi:Dienelactone hydrolase family protein [Tistlia consotensis]|uniref:Dienelactone hydrolase family protein n=1 Tax=Tistlia consotensis USBA 355 TaxID=560819 RepID=A0A1Y6B677_9PROT|nr:alpha/beta family hydrolase [Tistlia consotensis]SME89974.1 Dienelactone hydrolase family protein [Tistlia consotensis USBA 355]SNR26477.1 Dienelactone hydrolase family protein [Tistlia consotensis]
MSIAQTLRLGERGSEGFLALPAPASGLVVFAHGSGSSRFSPRNGYVAERLNEVGLATLLFDLLSEEEAADRRKVFDIPLLGSRVAEAVEALAAEDVLAGLPLGLFGASTGAGAALVAAAALPERVAAVVSRGGRPDLAGAALSRVRCPTLLVVGGDDTAVIELNREAMGWMTCKARLAIVPGATHLFEEPGTLDQVVELAADWFRCHFAARP